MSTLAAAEKQLLEKFAAFAEKQDLTLVHEALELVEAVERDVPLGDSAARQAALSLRLTFMAELERNIDPKWDSSKTPVRGATPPTTMAGIVYATGEVDPSTIVNPDERAKYERELKASKDYERWYHLQYDLRRIDEQSIRFMEVWLAQHYRNFEADRRELDQVIETSRLSEVRKEQMRTLTRDSSGP